MPILVESSYEIPACVGAQSLVFAISGSGNTDEVNHTAAASAERGARIAVVTTGGRLADSLKAMARLSSRSRWASNRHESPSAWWSPRS